MTAPRQSPPLRWLFGDPDQRKIARQYWITDTAVGLYETILYYLMRGMPIDLASYIGAVITHISRHFYRESEQRARKLWLQLRPGESDPASVDTAMTRLWRCVSRTMAEFAVLHRLWDAGRIAVEGLEHLERARAQDKPVILALIHLGNWEVIQVVCARTGHGGHAIYLPPENRFERRIAIEVRNRVGTKLIAPGPDSARAVLRVLRENKERFAIFVDEFSQGRVNAPAFGRSLPPGGNIAYAVRFAAMAGADIIPMYCLRLGDTAHFKVTVLPPIDLVRTRDKEADLKQNIARLDAAIAPVIRDHLDQWYFALDFELES